MRRIALSVAFIIGMAGYAAGQNPLPGPGATAPQPGVQGTASANRPTTGTARIRGRVVAADTGAPLRGADVTLSGDLLRQAEADADGRYEFTDLPAGRYNLSAAKPGYAANASTPFNVDPGRVLILSDAQVMNRDLTLTRGGVIRGRITDDAGEPAAGIEIRVERFTYTPGGRELTTVPLGAPLALSTNDLGEYRVYGLPPGEWVVSGRTRQFGAVLASGRAGAGDRAEGFLVTYYPGTTRVADAQAIRVAPGAETTANFGIVSGRLSRISGTVTTSGRPPSGLNVFLGVETSNSSGQINGGPVSADGSFSVGNIPPGSYVLRVREPGSAPRGTETASMPITIATEDLSDLSITTRPGTTIHGRVEWEGTSPRPANPVRISTRSAVWSGGPLGGESTITYLDLENGTVREDDTFELGGITGNVLFGSSPATPWMLKSATLNGRDITDVGVDHRSLGGDARVVITMTDKSTTVTGTVRDARRQPLSDYVVVLLPQRPIEGMAATRWIRFLRSDQGGSFSVRSMPAGDYVAAAFATLESGRQWDPALQQAARARGHRFTLTDGQTLSLDLELLR